jgi:Flp pilus assembly protein TadD
LKDAGSSGDTTKTPARRRRLPKVTPETPESRAAEDLTVADFYQKDGNYLGAYDRAKDAVQYQPNDPYAHFALAEAAFKLGKRDEAKTEYMQVLKLDPIPKQSKAAERALQELASAKK